MQTVMMGELTSPEFKARIAAGYIVLLPVGATEQHGPALPLATDVLLATALAKLAAEAHGKAIVAPTIPYGAKSQPASGGGQAFAGTTSLDAKTLIDVVRDVLRELVRHGCRRIVVLPGHYENVWYLTEGIELAIREARWEGITDLQVIQGGGGENSKALMDEMFPEGFPGDALEHAARIETSMAMHLFPHLVREDLVPDEPAGDFPPWKLFPQELVTVPSKGVLYPPRGYSAEFGRRLTEEAVAGLLQVLDEGFR